MHHESYGSAPRRPHLARSQHRNAGEEYIENAVRAASPARLRLMLINRAVEVAGALLIKYRDENGSRGPNEQSIHLLDLLAELLGGVGNHGNELCVQVADLYVFLCKELVTAEQQSSADRIESIRDVLRIESETWQLVCNNEQPAAILAEVADLNTTMSAGLNLQG